MTSKAKPALPARGGRYIRQKDGGLKKDTPPAPKKAAAQGKESS